VVGVGGADIGITNGYRGWELRKISSIGILKLYKQSFLCVYIIIGSG